jgi:hypothetical protein
MRVDDSAEDSINDGSLTEGVGRWKDRAHRTAKDIANP